MPRRHIPPAKFTLVPSTLKHEAQLLMIMTMETRIPTAPLSIPKTSLRWRTITITVMHQGSAGSMIPIPVTATTITTIPITIIMRMIHGPMATASIQTIIMGIRVTTDHLYPLVLDGADLVSDSDGAILTTDTVDGVGLITDMVAGAILTMVGVVIMDTDTVAAVMVGIILHLIITTATTTTHITMARGTTGG